jgi:hypothetical protein
LRTLTTRCWVTSGCALDLARSWVRSRGYEHHLLVVASGVILAVTGYRTRPTHVRSAIVVRRALTHQWLSGRWSTMTPASTDRPDVNIPLGVIFVVLIVLLKRGLVR